MWIQQDANAKNEILVIGNGQQAPYGDGELIEAFPNTEEGKEKAVAMAERWYNQPFVIYPELPSKKPESLLWRIYEDGRLIPVIDGICRRGLEIDGHYVPTADGNYRSIVTGSDSFKNYIDKEHHIKHDDDSDYDYVEWNDNDLTEPIYFDGIFEAESAEKYFNKLNEDNQNELQ